MRQDKQYAANRRLLEYQVRMEIKEKIVVNKWRFLSMAVRCILFILPAALSFRYGNREST
jgi:hypothetical protein